jgi:hypothetical protein
MNSTQGGKTHGKPFRNNKQEATRERYSKVWTQFILFSLRLIDTDEPLKNLKLTYEFQESLRRLRDTIHGHGDKDIMEELLSVSIHLITHSDWTKEYSIIKYVSGLLGWSASSGRWQLPEEYTPTLARILFCMQVLGLEYSLPTTQRIDLDHNIDNPNDKLNQFREQWLVEDQPTPFNELHKLLNYGYAAAKDGVGCNWIRIDADEEWLYYKGECMSIAKLKEFQTVILRKAEEILSRKLLFSKSNTVPDLNLYQFQHEDFSNVDKDYYFADTVEDWRTKNLGTAFDSLKINSSQWDILVDEPASMSEGRIVWKLEGIKQYEQSCKEFLEYIVVAVNMQGGETGRGEEMMMTTYKNTSADERNWKVDSGQLVLDTTYHKSQHMIDRVKVSLLYSRLT